MTKTDREENVSLLMKVLREWVVEPGPIAEDIIDFLEQNSRAIVPIDGEIVINEETE